MFTVPASINGKDVTLGIDTGGPFSSLTLGAANGIGNVGRRERFCGSGKTS